LEKKHVRKITMKNTNSIGKKSLIAIARRMKSFVLAMLTFMVAPAAYAQVLDAVDVQQRGADAEIVIRFANPVLYLRHNPLEEGRSVRVYLKLVGVGMQDGDLAPDSRRLPATGSAPAATIMFPESDGALSVSFDRSTRFSVRPGADGRSISILIPSKAGG
jgi:hypothetical protein